MKLKVALGFIIACLSFSSVWAAKPVKGGGVGTDCAVQNCDDGPISKQPPTYI